MFASFIAAGQTCVQGSRLLLQRSIHDRVLDLLVSRVSKIRVGDPTDGSTQMGPLVSQRQLDIVQKYVGIGKSEGATLACGGNSLQGALGEGCYHEPTVLSNVTNDMRIAQVEIFEPVVCVMPFEGEADAIRLANGTAFGLAASVWSGNIARAHRVAQRLR